MDVSLVVCTRNRAPQLAEALRYLDCISAKALWEIIFVDNGSTDATASILAAFVKTSAMNATLVNEPKPGVSAARNAGWRRARGSVVAFTDDDCYPTPEYIDEIFKCFQEDAVSYLGGRVLLFDRNDSPITIQTLEQRVEIPPHSFVAPGLIHGANFAFRKSVLDLVGDFDERLGAGTKLLCGEDVDMLARASSLGFRGIYDPGPVVFHHHRRSKPEEVKRLLEGYDIGRGAYFAKSLLDRRRFRAFLWPAIRKIGGDLSRLEFDVLSREINGAWNYVFG